ncbi:hypothetical protein [Aquimarina sediminis]|uniref:hypothetical protein n=1 Tax=Aquimarina sediminis TaxID=2070536 RepID=UPI000CA08911|nr:hypothetical protein [Aquimarina sediminis]
MKKLMYLAVFSLAFGFTACGSDDDGSSNCRECSLLGVPISVCDNGDGTIKVSGGGETQTVTLEEGTTYDQYADALCSGTIPFGL